MLISDAYRAENALQHSKADGYGQGGHKHLQHVINIAAKFGCQTVLDYGCGQGTLAAHAKRLSELKFSQYDPAIPEHAADPAPADLVVCTDVMEHVEPYCLHAVLQHISKLALKGVYFEIATRPAKRVLSNGDNAHCMVRQPYFWFDTLRNYFDIVEMSAVPGHAVMFICRPEGEVWT